MSYIGKLFAHLHPSTNELDSAILNKTTELIYCCRDGVESVTLVVDNRQTLRDLVGDLPPEIYNTTRYGVDLSSIGTDKVRIYLNSHSSEEHIIGYYFSSDNKVLQKKNYKKTDTTDALIDRYESDGTEISMDEVEAVASRADWGGSSSLADSLEKIVSDNNFILVYSKREGKDQSYIKVAAY